MLRAINVVTAILHDLRQEVEYPLSLLAIPQQCHQINLASYVSFTVDLVRYAVDAWAFSLGWRYGIGAISNARELWRQVEMSLSIPPVTQGQALSFTCT